MPQCAKCHTQIIGNPFRFKGEPYCLTCYNQITSEIEEKTQKKQELFDYIVKFFNVKECPSEIIRGMERLLKEGKTIFGIKATIYYYYKILGNEINETSFKFLVKNVEDSYKSAKDYVAEQKRINEKNREVDLNIPPQIVRITPSKSKPIFDYNMEDL